MSSAASRVLSWYTPDDLGSVRHSITMLRALVVLFAIALGAAAHPSLDEMKAAITASPELFDELALHADELALHAKRELKKGKPGQKPKKIKKGYMKCKKKAPLLCENGEIVCGPKPLKPDKKPAKEEDKKPAKEDGDK